MYTVRFEKPPKARSQKYPRSPEPPSLDPVCVCLTFSPIPMKSRSTKRISSPCIQMSQVELNFPYLVNYCISFRVLINHQCTPPFTSKHEHFICFVLHILHPSSNQRNFRLWLQVHHQRVVQVEHRAAGSLVSRCKC